MNVSESGWIANGVEMYFLNRCDGDQDLYDDNLRNTSNG